MAAQGRREPLLTYMTAQKGKKDEGDFFQGLKGLEEKTQRQPERTTLTTQNVYSHEQLLYQNKTLACGLVPSHCNAAVATL